MGIDCAGRQDWGGYQRGKAQSLGSKRGVYEILVSPAGPQPLQAELPHAANKWVLHSQRENHPRDARDSASGKLIQVVITIL